MGFTRKVRENLERLEYDPALGYRVWPEANVLYKQVSPHTIAHKASNGEDPEVTRQTLLGTFAFLAGLLVVGFIAGYAMRGTAYAETSQNGLMSLTMTAVPAVSGFDIDNDQSSLVASIGSQAPDELIQLVTAPDDSLSVLIRVHDNTKHASDQFSLVQVSSTGKTVELLRQDSTGIRAIDMSQLDSGQLVLASLHPELIEMRGLSPQGQNEWSRKMNIATDHQAGVIAVSTSTGTAIAGPSEKVDRISLTYLSTDGELLWQRSFAANTVNPDIWLESNPDGSVFLASRASENDLGQDYSLMRIDVDGQDLWRASIGVDGSASLAGLAATGDGGVYALTKGGAPALIKFDPLGARVWSVDVPQAKFSDSIHLIAAPSGNSVVAVSYAVANQRLDVWLEERDSLGRVVGEANLALPDSSSVRALEAGSKDRYFVAGSVLPDRFDDADIFVKDVKLKAVSRPAQLVAATMPLAPDMLANVAADAGALGSILDGGIDDADIVALADPTDVAGDPEVMEISESATLLASLETVEVITDPVVEPVLSDAPQNNEAALSRFVSTELSALRQFSIVRTSNGVQAQCRFSCLEKGNSSASFPMWRAIEAPQSAYDSGLPAVHELTCRAAGGTRNMLSTPDCNPS